VEVVPGSLGYDLEKGDRACGDYLGDSGSTSEDDAMINTKLHGICRGR
jgi:hypothetical protein